MAEKEDAEKWKREALESREKANTWEQKVREEQKRNIDLAKTKLPELKEMVSASTSIYRTYLNLWIKLLLIFGLCFGGGFLAYYFLPFPKSNFNSTQIGNIANSIFDPSVTVAGIVIGFFPVIGFFYMTEMKEKQREAENLIRKQMNDYGKSADMKFLQFDEQDLKVLDDEFTLFHKFWGNLRSGLIQYIATFLVVAILMLFFLITLYVISPIFFIAFDMFVLATALTGVFPIIRHALRTE